MIGLAHDLCEILCCSKMPKGNGTGPPKAKALRHHAQIRYIARVIAGGVLMKVLPAHDEGGIYLLDVSMPQRRLHGRAALPTYPCQASTSRFVKLSKSNAIDCLMSALDSPM